MVIRFAVRVAVSFEEIPGAQFLAAMRADEVLRMPGLAQRGDHLADDGLIASRAASFLRRIHSLLVHVRLKATQHRIQLSGVVFLSLTVTFDASKRLGVRRIVIRCQRARVILGYLAN